MTEELKQDEKCCKCECKELLAKLAIITTGSFIGCLLALCVFTTFAKPPMQPCPYAQSQIEHRIPPRHDKFEKPNRHHHKIDKKDFKHKKFEKQREFKGDWDRKKQAHPEKPNRSDKPVQK